MKGTRNLFVKKYIPHGMEDVRIESYCELTNVTCTLVLIEYLVKSDSITASSIDNFSLLEG